MSGILNPRHFVSLVLVAARKAELRLGQALMVEGEVDMFAKGQRFDEDVVSAWARGKLPIDKLVLEGSERATPKNLLGDLETAWSTHEDFAALEAAAESKPVVRKFINCLALPAPLELHLTTMRVAAPVLYAKSLAGAWLAVVVGAKLKLERADLEKAFRGALLRDLGMLYADPELTGPDYDVRLSASDREQLQAHAKVGSDLVNKYGGAAFEAVADLVAQHHERLDGSGYPRGMRGLDLSLAARLIGLVDVVAAIRLRPGSAATDLSKVLTMLLMDRHGFDDALYACLLKMTGDARAAENEDDEGASALAMRLSMESQSLAEQVVELEDKLRARAKNVGREVQAGAQRVFSVLRRSGLADREVTWWLKKVALGRDKARPDELQRIELQMIEMRRQFERLESDLGGGPDMLTFQDVVNKR